ncbi:hypothetical protein MMC31_007685 [Peltigera leucophlebia]|nr:hypothetical protein [Peltigera leucophlebia]
MDDVPSILKQHISDLRKPREAPSPNAKKITKIAPSARSLSEQDGIDKLGKRLLLVPGRKGGMERAAKLNLNPHFLPPATDIMDESLRLEMPQPDHCFGYLLLRKAKAMQAMKWPFTTTEEKILAKFTLTEELHFPFLTAQWESPAEGQTHHQAIPQGALDGSTIVNYLHQFYTTARPTQAPSLIETCHFSVTIDMRSIILWVHWWEQDEDKTIRYYKEEFESGMLNKERDMNEIRTILRNLQDHALGHRLQVIKKLLPAFSEHFLELEPAQTVTAVSSFSGIKNHPVFESPTPSSDALEPVRKKRRME